MKLFDMEEPKWWLKCRNTTSKIQVNLVIWRTEEQEQYSRRTNLRLNNVPVPTSFTSESIQPVYDNKIILRICNMEHMSSLPVFSEVRVTRSLVLCVCFVDRCLSFCPFSFGQCFVCPSSMYRFWLPLWYIQTLLIGTTCITFIFRLYKS
jgi:hypothetical protein